MNYAELTREERTSHIDLTIPCTVVRAEKYSGKVIKFGRNGKKQVTYFNRGYQALKKYLKRSRPTGWHVCHLCPNCTTSEYICVNPRHLYFGSPKENSNDYVWPQEDRLNKQKMRELAGFIQQKIEPIPMNSHPTVVRRPKRLTPETPR